MKKIIIILISLLAIGLLFGCTETNETKNPTNTDPAPEDIDDALDEFDEEVEQALGKDRDPTPEVIDLSACNLLSLEESGAIKSTEFLTRPSDKIKTSGCTFYNSFRSLG